MKVTGKDFVREIKNSRGRFFSILFIVALGVAFFSGIRASEPDMRITGDYFYDTKNLMDIKIVSTLGLTEEDIDSFQELDQIACAEGSYSMDALSVTETSQRALHIQSIPKKINEITVTEGRMPEKIGECLADNETGYKVGDTISLKSGTDKSLSDSLRTEELTVVGLGNSPCFISFARGSTTIGTGSIYGFLIVPEETFAYDVYTEGYLQVKGAKEQTAYTEEYEHLIDDAMDRVEEHARERGRMRRQELVDEATEKLDEARADLEEGRRKAQEEIEDGARKIADAEQQITDARKKIQDGWTKIQEGKTLLVQKQAELTEAKQKYEEGYVQFQGGKSQYEQGKAEYEAAKPQMEQGILASEQAIEALSAQDPQGLVPEIQAQIQELQATILGIRTQMESTEATLAQTKAVLDEKEQELSQIPQQLQSGQEQIDSGWAEIQRNEQELRNGESEIAQNEGKLQEAKEELEEGKRKAADEIAEGEKKIAEAQQEIDDIPEAEWYINDRTNLPDYSGFGENADRMKSLGKVFPILFFLVAALISLTSMTRMVEEHRVQIGTRKALGYSKASIAWKYLGYAGIATLTGSVVGVLIGEKIFPFIIIYAYGIMYHPMKEILVPYAPVYGIAASAIAILCVVVATLFACYRELGAQPAILMRPPAPKKGKRVFLERIPFIWKRLNFTWKSTVRNLFRYKKRFFMTVFGIGGCMALMIVGYGIRDSVYEIADVQYADIQVYDGQIILQDDCTEEELKELGQYLDENKNIDRSLNTYMKSMTVSNGDKEREVYLVVPEKPGQIDEFVDFHDRITKEAYRLSDDGVIISEKTCTLLDVKEGDTVFVEDEKGHPLEIKIAHIMENYMSHYIYMTPSYYEKTFGKQAESNSVLFAAKSGLDEEQIKNEGEKIIGKDQVLSITYMTDIREQLDHMLSSLNLVIIVLIVSAGMLAFVVLYNLNTINITERQRELATLKVLGFYDPEVAIYVFRENIILTFVGAAVGCGLGKVLHRFVITTVEVDAAMFGRSIYLPSFLYSLAFTVAFSLLVNALMYFKLKKISMVESLKSVE